MTTRIVGLLVLLSPALATAEEADCKDANSCSKAVEEVAEEAVPPEFDKLRTPDSPAFSILGVSPSEVERPNSPRALVLALGAFANQSGTDLIVPDSFALEVNPYSLIYKDANFQREDGVSARAFGKNLTISVGTANEDVIDPMTMDKTSLPTKLAVGVRSRVYDAQDRKPKCVAAFTKIQDKIKATSKAERDRIQALPAAERDAAYQQVLEEQALLKNIEVDVADLKTGQCLQGSGLGWSVDAALATSAHYADGKLQWIGGHHHVATAGWLSAAHQWEHGSLVFLGRWRAEDTVNEMDRNAYERRQYVDVGTRGIYARDKYGASLEAVVRYRYAGDPFADEDAFYMRFAVLADYKVGDNQWLNVTFGKNFGGAPDASDIFTLANLKWSFDAERTVIKAAKKDAKKEAAGDADAAKPDETVEPAPPTPPAPPPAPAPTARP
ncbi:MAG TPA: hypothetical protein VIV40_44235 [Kofleriaceae bacterium]